MVSQMRMASKKTLKSIDITLAICIFILLVIGVVMVFSSSFYYAMSKFDDKFFFVKSEIKYTIIGVIAMIVVSYVPYKKLERFAPAFFIVSIIGLLLVLTPLGTEIKGARRWIDFGPFTVMPSELARLAGIIFFSSKLSKKNVDIKDLKGGLSFYLICIALIAGLIMKQPNMSTAVSITLTLGAILFVAGMRWAHLVIIGSSGIVAAIALIATSDYRRRRALSFLDPMADPLGDGWQVVQSLFALGTGGTFGVGLGQSIMNKLYIPEPANDFIFATVGEEFGFVGSVALIMIFAVLVYRGFKIAMDAPDQFGFFMAIGITAMVGIQVMINICVATSLIPPTGIPLPFISVGGTHLVTLLVAMGILLNISKHRINE